MLGEVSILKLRFLLYDCDTAAIKYTWGKKKKPTVLSSTLLAHYRKNCETGVMNLAGKGLKAKSSNSSGCHEVNSRMACPVPEKGTLEKCRLSGRGLQESSSLSGC